jgi:predicted DNA-binding transcriptional regulator AlpA
MKPKPTENESKKRYLRDREIEANYGIGRMKLRQLRHRGIGPAFRRIGYKTIIYEISDLERWIDSQPQGGEAR